MTTITIDRAVVEQALHVAENSGYPLALIKALRAALAQQQAEPPGCDHCNHPLYAATRCRVCGRVTEQAEPVEPVAYIHRQGNSWDTSERHLTDDEKARGWTEEPLYTAPPQRKPLPQLAESQCPHPEGHPSLRDAWLDGWEAAERAHGIGGQE